MPKPDSYKLSKLFILAYQGEWRAGFWKGYLLGGLFAAGIIALFATPFAAAFGVIGGSIAMALTAGIRISSYHLMEASIAAGRTAQGGPEQVNPTPLEGRNA